MSLPTAVCARRVLVGVLDWLFGRLLERALAMANPVTLRVGVTASHVLPPSATLGSAGAAKRVELTARGLHKSALACAFRLPNGTAKEPASDNAPLSQP